MNLFAKTVLFQFFKTGNGKKYLVAETERTQYLIPPGKKTEDEIFASLNIEGGYDYCNVVIIDQES